MCANFALIKIDLFEKATAAHRGSIYYRDHGRSAGPGCDTIQKCRRLILRCFQNKNRMDIQQCYVYKLCANQDRRYSRTW